MHTADDKLFSYNFRSIFQSEASRLVQHQHFILDHYLKQFNEEIIQPKSYTHCGEPCSIACKKYSQIYKKDYEPYQALGPQCGIFDQRAAEQLNHFIDALGIDAIQMGGMISWLMECIAQGMIPPEDFGLPPATEMRFEFASSTAEFNVVEDSSKNAHYASAIADMILFHPEGETFRKGIRIAAQILDARYQLSDPGNRISDRAVFTAHAENGCMVPNQYWVPGMLSPMPMMGKYFVYYGFDYLPPKVLGRKCVERMIYELYSENSGVCRFHRKWVEAIVDEIISAHYHFPVDYKIHQFEVARQIFDHEKGKARSWDSERTIDVIFRYLETWEHKGLQDESLLTWLERFRQDKWSAARNYWDEVFQGITEAFNAGPQAIPDVVAPYQAARLDVMTRSDVEQIPKNGKPVS
jgi:glyceraldehyde-3-phosphate dehydrogenase (ferredoxin)